MTTRARIARLIDHTLLKPEATTAQVNALIAEAADLNTYSVCVSPSLLPLEVPDDLHVATVCGFPSGAHATSVKAAEAADALAKGAEEIDMVVNLRLVKEGDADAVEADIRGVREACRGAVLKVIIESAALTDEEIVSTCRAAEAAGADFVKTSTGFHPAGGASTHAVALMRATVGERLGVKASGGIRTAADALAMVEAGANRLGLSASAAVLEGLADRASSHVTAPHGRARHSSRARRRPLRYAAGRIASTCQVSGLRNYTRLYENHPQYESPQRRGACLPRPVRSRPGCLWSQLDLGRRRGNGQGGRLHDADLRLHHPARQRRRLQ